MRNRALLSLVVVNLLLMGVCALLWVTPSGAVRENGWHEPAPIRADIRGLVPSVLGDRPMEVGRFLAMLERPLFAATRRPPPPPPPEAPPPPPDHLGSARVTGIVAGDGTGYVILLVNGKQRRVQMNQGVEGWTLKSLGDRQVTFVQGEQSRVLSMQRADVSKFAGVAQPTPRGVPQAQSAPVADVSGGVSSGGSAASPAVGAGQASALPRPPPPRFGP